MSKVNKKCIAKFLNQGQQLELDIKSVDYDVWVTKDLSEKEIVPIVDLYSRYSACEKCNYITFHQVYDMVITPSTYSDIGEGEIKKECKY